jgi:hypothetical protein
MIPIFAFVHVPLKLNCGGKKINVSIDDDHVCKSKTMTPYELMKHLKNEGDSTHKAILAYLTKLSSSQWGHARQHPARNSISWPVGYHDKLAGARSATAVHQNTITNEGKNTVLVGSGVSLKGPDQEVTHGAGEKKDMEAGAKTATAVHKEVAGGLGEKVVPVASKNAGHKPESETTGGGENTVMGGSDLSLNGPDKEVTNGAGETTDVAAGIKTATAVDNDLIMV